MNVSYAMLYGRLLGGNHAMEDSMLLRTLTEYTNDRVKDLGDSALANNYLLTSVNLPALEKISGTAVFSGCTKLTSIMLPKVTTLKGTSTFTGCTGLVCADFPEVTAMGQMSFYRCSALKSVILRKEQVVTITNTNTFNNSPVADGEGHIYVPASVLEDYKAHSIWGTYSIRALEDYTVDGTITGALDESKI